MTAKRVDELSRRLGPVIFARANRALKNQQAAERLTLEVVGELAKLDPGLSEKALLQRGRELLEARTAKQIDSLLPK